MKEPWSVRTRLKALAQPIVVRNYGLIITDEALMQWRMNCNMPGREISDERLRIKLLKDRVTDLIGPVDDPDAFFIYGRGTVCFFFRSLRPAHRLISLKHNKPQGAFEHTAIRDLIVRYYFATGRRTECLADVFGPEDCPFNPVPLPTIALATTAVKYYRHYIFSYH